MGTYASDTIEEAIEDHAGRITVLEDFIEDLDPDGQPDPITPPPEPEPDGTTMVDLPFKFTIPADSAAGSWAIDLYSEDTGQELFASKNVFPARDITIDSSNIKVASHSGVIRVVEWSKTDEEPDVASGWVSRSAGSVKINNPITPPVPTPSPVSAHKPVQTHGMSSLANFRIGYSRNDSASYSYTAEHTSTLTALRMYWVVNLDRSGYAGGNGGIIRVRVCPALPNGAPDLSKVFAGKFDATFGLVDGYRKSGYAEFVREKMFGLWRFDQPIPQVKGQRYHVLFENVDPNPKVNYISIDLTYDMDRGQNIVDPTEKPYGHWRRAGKGGWTDYTNGGSGNQGRWTPIIDLTFANGGHQGPGWIAWRRDDDVHSLAGSGAARMVYKPPVDVTVSKLWGRVVAGAGSVKLQIETLGGDVIRSSVRRAAGQVNYRGEVWVEGEFDPVVLEAGTEYALVIRSSDFRGILRPLQCGKAYGFHPSTYFEFGHPEKSVDGSRWQVWQGGSFFPQMALE